MARAEVEGLAFVKPLVQRKLLSSVPSLVLSSRAGGVTLSMAVSTVRTAVSKACRQMKLPHTGSLCILNSKRLIHAAEF